MREFYESVWAAQPEDPEPWAWRRRRALLLGEARPGERVLDLGCGAGRFVAALRDAGADPVGVELAEAALERARRNVPGRRPAAVAPDGTLPLGHGEVDLVWCSEVLEHVPDTVGFLTEVRRVLQPGGRLLVTVPDHGRLQAHADRARAATTPTTTRSASTCASTRAARSRARCEATGFTAVALARSAAPPLLREALVARALRA